MINLSLNDEEIDALNWTIGEFMDGCYGCSTCKQLMKISKKITSESEK